MSYHDAVRRIDGAGDLRAESADRCVWLVDERGGGAQSIHLTPGQALAAADALREVGEGARDGHGAAVPIGGAGGAPQGRPAGDEP